MKQGKAICFAVLAAAFYAINSPVSKLLLEKLSAAMLAALLYLGAGLGLFLVGLVQKKLGRGEREKPLTKKELPYTIGMVVLDIAAPIFLMLGLRMTTAANASLLNNFEIVATSVIALCIFKEVISKRLWLGIALVTAASLLLSFEDLSTFSFSAGSVFVLLACVCWGFENNCTKMLSSKNPLEVVVIKGFCSGTGSLLIAIVRGECSLNVLYILFALLLGFVAYGLSIFFYIYAQRYLGAAKTSAYYAVSPFLSAILSLLIFRELPTMLYVAAFVIMLVGTYFVTIDGREKQ
ncbi:DMT family transporter [uncultured Ruminococcus sp.]|uniref:DMT family transporter n=1 Tax=uncultured Ruminococcus sp. TaxID=165186 RepID=UPI00261A8B8E|nr:DMT family transporter [uncultured Ruminococcus sp.]